METWFPQLTKTAKAAPRLRVLTFPNAGSAENVYTGFDKTPHDGLAGRRENRLIKWAKDTDVEVLAAQPPGRDARIREAPLGSCAAVAKAAFDVVKAHLFEKDDAPWALFAHSMGTWVAFEFALLARAAGMRPPVVFVASGFPSPSCADDKRPWTPSAGMSEEDFKAEARKWKINEVVFSDGMWKMYADLLRADFGCFDAYPQWPHGDRFDKFTFPVRVFYGSEDDRATLERVSEWASVSADVSVAAPISGHHLFVYDEAARAAWFTGVTAALDAAAPAMLQEYVVVGKNGAALRAGLELTTNAVLPELPKGTTVTVRGVATSAAGAERVHLASYALPGEQAVAVDAWASKRLFEFQKLVKASDAAFPPAPPAAALWGGATVRAHRFVVSGKNGAMLRAGPELDSDDISLTLPPGTECFCVDEATNAKGASRVRVTRYAAGGAYAAVDGWCTAKFLCLDEADVAVPDVGAVPFRPFVRAATGAGTMLLFPGQGAQKVGMLEPYLSTPGVVEMFAEASAVFGVDLLDMVQNGPEASLNDTRFSQVCVFLTSLAAVRQLQVEDPKAVSDASACAGFSLGEYTALAFAGVMEVSTAVRLLKVRGEAMKAACDAGEPSGMMTVVGLDEAALEGLLADAAGAVTVANQLFPGGRVLSGAKGALATLEAAIAALALDGVKTIVQPVSGAFHSKFMAPAAETLRGALAAAHFSPPLRTVYSNVTARPHSGDVDEIKDLMAQQLVKGVLWEDTMRHVIAHHPNMQKFIEPAPGRQLASMMRRVEPSNVPKMKHV
ncbi:hypothetical protein M885DRAFT_514645 [Pelagophyceae sp. CCMP2097]|nr:hypothetical protein M885DRAFT_514645 [Pelagophyceae sp. CCMP2097]